MAIHIGMLLYPGLTQLDLTGPFEVLYRVPEAKVHLVWKTTEPLLADSGLTLVPTMTLSQCPPLEYDPEPPFRCGHPDVAEPEVLARVRARFDESLRARASAARSAASEQGHL